MVMYLDNNYHLVNSHNNRLLPLIIQFFLIHNRITECNISPPFYTLGTGNLYVFKLTLNPKRQVPGTNSSAICFFFFSSSLPLCMFNSCKKWLFTLPKMLKESAISPWLSFTKLALGYWPYSDSCKWLSTVSNMWYFMYCYFWFHGP
jgi:hypothetical protein